METSDKNTQQQNQKMPSQGPNDSGRKRGGLILIAFAIIATLGSLAFLVVSQQNKKKAYSELESQYRDLSGQLITRDSLLNDWVSLFNQVEKDLQAIQEKENLLTTMQSEDMELTRDNRETILRDIQMLNTLLEANKKKIAQLNNKLKTSGMKIAGLEKKVEELAFTLEERNRSIDTLKANLVEKDFALSELNTQITGMEVNLAQKQTAIETQTAELNKAYIASGSYKELKEKGLISKEGGFLWVGRTTSLNDNVVAENFTEVDITQATTISVNSKKVELITEHPGNSYEFVKDENELIASINITDPNEFWRISKYAVVETRK